MADRKIKRALIAVYDKTGIVEFARALVDEFGIEIVSTGGTAKHLKDAGIPVTMVEQVTGFPEMLDGRVKTLHPKIHAAILADRDNPIHMRQLEEHGIKPIDMVVVNLYPFEKTVADPNCKFEDAIEMIDIGGPCLLRAAAKNHRHVLVVEKSASIDNTLSWMRGEIASPFADFSETSAMRAFREVTQYDAEITRWFGQIDRETGKGIYRFIELFDWGRLRYGENPHQPARLTKFWDRWSSFDLTVADIVDDESAQATLSYNNYVDADAALSLCSELTRAKSHPSCTFIKHTNACGVGVANDPFEAYRRAYLGDVNAAMGGILAVNFDVTPDFAETVMHSLDRWGKAAGAGAFFIEVWVAPAFDEEAVKTIRSAKKWGENVRLLAVGDMTQSPDPEALEYKTIAGGMLAQTPDVVGLNEDQWKVVTRRRPTESEMADLRLAWLIAKHTKSNAISICKNGMLIGNGAGQMSRLMSCRIATWLARENGHLRDRHLGDRPPAGLSEEQHSRRHLPHIERPEASYFITFRLRDGQLSPAERDIVLAVARFWHVTKMTLHCVSVMPDHVHLLLTPYESATGRWVPLGELLKSIKSFSASRINVSRNARGALWQDENFDRIIRSERDFIEKWEYILANPVTAGLVTRPEEYPWFWKSEFGFGEIAGVEDRPEAGPPNQLAGPPNQLAGPPNQLAGFPNQLAGFPNQLAGFPNQLAGFPNQLAGPPNQLAGPPNQLAGFPNQLAGPPVEFAVSKDRPEAGPPNQLAGPPNQLAGPPNQLAGLANPVVGAQSPPGAGQPVGSPIDGPVAASDAFFPFRDGPDILIDAGVTAIIQPGGSKRDEDTIKACDERGVAMIFTGTRHFKH